MRVNRSLVKKILKRDNFTCQECGKVFKEDGSWPDTHHILPKRDGGTDDPENLITLCEECHNKKHKIRPFLKGRNIVMGRPRKSDSKYMIAVSCPQGKEYHQRLKKAFPQLSAKIMELLQAELLKVESDKQNNDARNKWLLISPYPALKRMIGNGDPFDYETTKVIEMLQVSEIVVTEKEAAHLINKLQNEWLDKHGGGR